jgi:hypothetical protein
VGKKYYWWLIKVGIFASHFEKTSINNETKELCSSSRPQQKYTADSSIHTNTLK